jgi:hypothetical protein
MVFLESFGVGVHIAVLDELFLLQPICIVGLGPDFLGEALNTYRVLDVVLSHILVNHTGGELMVGEFTCAYTE